MPTAQDLLVEACTVTGAGASSACPDRHTTAIYDALGDRHGGIRALRAATNRLGAFIADGYARVTGQPGVVCTTAGPGADQCGLTGVAEAYGDSMPVLLVSGHVNHDRLGREVGAGITKSIWRASSSPAPASRRRCAAAEQAPRLVAQAFAAMTSGRRRPAAIFMPQDLAGLPATNPLPDVGQDSAPDRTGTEPSAYPTEALDPDRIRQAVELLQRSSGPSFSPAAGPSGAGQAAKCRACRASQCASSRR